jgi:molybdate transport system ATP-binding protein
MMLEIRLRHQFAGFGLDVDFAAPAGLTALFGRSGSGKTTVVNAVAGILRPDEGRITVDGVVLLDGKHSLPPHRRRIGYVFQDARLFPHLTVRQNMLYGRWFAPRSDSGPNISTVADLLGLAPLLGRRPATLSGGEKSRVAIGRALLARPRLLLMDEPLAAVDETAKAEVLPYLERLRDVTAVPIIYVSHSVAEVARIATTVVVIEGGHVQRTGSAADILSDPASVSALGPRDMGAVLTARIDAHEADGLTRLSCAAGPIFVPQIDGKVGSIVRLRIQAQDVLLSRTRPTGLSALNILPATVREVRVGEGASALVRLALGDEMILARITRRSVSALELVDGTACFAILKSVAIAPGDIGR